LAKLKERQSSITDERAAVSHHTDVIKVDGDHSLSKEVALAFCRQHNRFTDQFFGICRLIWEWLLSNKLPALNLQVVRQRAIRQLNIQVKRVSNMKWISDIAIVTIVGTCAQTQGSES
jgi:hypothetical protein